MIVGTSKLTVSFLELFQCVLTYNSTYYEVLRSSHLQRVKLSFPTSNPGKVRPTKCSYLRDQLGTPDRSATTIFNRARGPPSLDRAEGQKSPSNSAGHIANVCSSTKRFSQYRQTKLSPLLYLALYLAGRRLSVLSHQLAITDTTKPPKIA